MPKITIPDFKGWEAWVYLFSSFIFLLTHPKVGFLLYFILPGLAWNEISHYTGYTVKIEAAQPVMPERIDTTIHGFYLNRRDSSDLASDFTLVPKQDFSVFPMAFAQEKKRNLSQDWQSENAIVIDGQFFGFYDPRFLIYKEQASNRILLYHKEAQSGYWIEMDSELFEVKTLRSMKK